MAGSRSRTSWREGMGAIVMQMHLQGHMEALGNRTVTLLVEDMQILGQDAL